MASILEKIKIMEYIVRAPNYSALGYTHDRLVYASNVEGIMSLWSFDVKSRKSIKLCDDIYGVAPIRPTSPLVVYSRDVSKGKELQQVFVIDCRGGKEFKFEDFEPKRIFGMGFDGNIIALSAASEKAIEIWILKPYSESKKVYETNLLLFVTDVGYGKIVGQGILKGNPKAYEIFIFDVKSNEFSVYTPKEGSVNKSPKIWHDKLLFATNAFGDEKLVIYDLSKNELVEPEFTYQDYKKYKFVEYVSFNWTPDGRIWFIGKFEGRTKAFIDGKEVPLPDGFSTNLVIAEDKVYATYSSSKTPYSIYEIDMKTKKYNVMLSSKLPKEVTDRFGDVYLIRYKSYDGLEIPTFIFESKVATKPGPTIVYVHGGPWSEVADNWRVFIATLVALGYHVVAPNFRGSTGYGEDFRRLDIGDPGGGDLLDVIYAAKWAKEKGLASKIAIMGYSYGGYMTFLATTKHPEVWDLGVAGAGVVDWEEMYELSDAIFKQFINVLFANKRELWKERSPIHYVENLKVPLCIIHPQNDTRTPLKPVLRFVMKLLELGKTFELHVIPDMGHLIRKMDDALKVLLPAIIFLDKYMK